MLPSERATEVVKERRVQHGNPNEHYARVAEFWNTWLSIQGVTDPDGVIRMIQATDVPMMMALFKIGRESTKHNDDNLTDICGWTNVFDVMRLEEDFDGPRTPATPA